MKKYSWVLAVVICLVAIYAAMSFVVLSIDFTQWSTGARILFVVISAGVCLPQIVHYTLSDE